MIEIFKQIPEMLIKTAIQPDINDVEKILEYLIPDDFLVPVNRQSKPADAPDEETPTLAELRRNMDKNKENEQQ